jgi:hypothetical protein
LEHSIFEFVSDFDIRISNLERPIQEIIPYRIIPRPGPLGQASLQNRGSAGHQCAKLGNQRASWGQMIIMTMATISHRINGNAA